ncbi:MAG TPA: Ig-like domain-containing protein [Candidatus Limnocylindrales bacterium]|nr:Ig-like domain-containing protein [Candidatus Limnocylindrales bacterium]
MRWLELGILAAGLAIAACAVDAVVSPGAASAACSGWPSSGGVPQSGHDYQDFTSGSNVWSNGHLRTKLPTSYTCSAWIRTYSYNGISIGTNSRYLWIREMTTAGGTTNCSYLGSGTDYMNQDGCTNADFSVIGATGISQNTTYTNFGIGYASCSTNYGAQVGWTTNHEPGANCGTPATRWPDGAPPKFDWTAPTAPTLTITPGANAFVSGTTIYVNGTVAGSISSAASGGTDSGGSGLAGYSHTLTGTTTGWTPLSSTTSSQAFSWTTAIVAGQSTTLTVQSRDTAGNKSSGVVRTIISDETAPVATFGAPPAAQSFTRVTAFTTTITVSDAPSGVASWSLARRWTTASNGVCGTTWTADGTVASGTAAVTAQNNAQTLVNARCYSWLLTATDHVGLVTTTTSGNVFVDVNQPTADFTTPNEGTTTTIATGTYSVAWVETETGSGLVTRSTQRQRGTIVTPGTCAGVSPANDGTPSTSTSPLSVTGLLGGSCYLWIETLTDAAGNTSATTSGWVLVSTGPSADFTTPDEAVTVRQSANSYTVAWTENGGVTTRSLQRQRGPIVTAGTCAGVSWANDGSPVTTVSPVVSSALLDGSCYRWIQTVGNGTTSAPFTSGSVLVDSTTPVTTFTSPAANAVQSSTQTTVAWTEGDSGSGITARFLQRQQMSAPGDGGCLGFSWSDDGSPLLTPTSPTTVTGLVAGRCYRWVLTLVDGVGNTTYATSSTILVDATALVADFAVPNEATTTVQSAGGIAVSWSEAGSAASVATRSMQRQSTTVSAGACGTTWTTSGAATAPTSTTVTVFGLAANTCYRWVLTTTDTAGNIGTATSGTIRISESVLPNTIAGQSMFATQTLSAQTTLGSVTNVQFLIDGTVVGSDTSSPYSAAVNMLAQSNGTHQLAVRVTQTGGATTTTPNTQIVVANGLNSKDRLATDYAVGLLAVDDWVLDGAYSIMAPNALPARYRSTAPYPDAEDGLAAYLVHRSEMSTSGQAALDAFVNQPFRGDLYQPTANLGGAAPGFTGCGLTRTTPAANGYPSFTVTYCQVSSTLVGAAAARGSASSSGNVGIESTGPGGCCHFTFTYVIGPATTETTVKAQDDGANGGFAGNGIPDIVDQTMVEFEEVYTYYRDVLQFNEPLTGNEQISVQVAAGGPSGNQAQKFIGPAHIDVNPNDGRLFGYAIPHELMHAFQYGYKAPGLFDEYSFWYEAAAQWGAHEFAQSKGANFDPGDEWTGDVGAYLSTSQFELSSTNLNGEQRQYAVNLLAEYLTERFRAAKPVRRTWELIGSGQGGKQAIVSVVNEQPGASFDSFFADYAQTAYQMSLTDSDLAAWTNSLDGYAARHPLPDPLFTGPDDLGNDRPVRHRAEPSLNNDVSNELELGELGMGYVDVKPIFAGQPGQVTIRVQRPDNNVRARWVWYRLINPANPGQGTSVCGVPVDITFNNNEGSVTQAMTSDCFFGTMMFTRVGGAGFAPFGSKIKWTATVGVGVVSNGTVQLGVSTMGNIDVPGGTPSTGTQDTYVGLRLISSNYDGLAPGCKCEGWGVSNGTTSGWVSGNLGTQGINVNSFTATTNSARSDVTAAGTFKVVHQFDPVPGTPNVFKITVSITNVGAAPATLLYRRTMDWDVEPTAFEEYITIGSFGAVPSELVYTDNNGFATPDPLAPRSPIGATGMFVDYGPDDTGALFDFNFGSLGVNQTKTFTLFYGAAPNEGAAISALQAVGAVVYSLGEPSNQGGPDLGQPITFFFGYKP